MRKSVILLAILAVALVWSGTALAQHKNSNGIGYFALQVPDPAAMVMDARDGDWAWFDPSFVIGTDQLESTIAKPLPERDDWDASVRVAWTAAGQGGEGVENMIYCFAIVTDDTLSHDVTDPDKGFNNDDMEMATDMDNSGGPFPDRINAQQWSFHLSDDTYPRMMQLRYQLPPEMQWGLQAPYAEGMTRVEPEGSSHLSANVTVYYEWRIAGWDDYRGGGPDASVRHNLTAGETVTIGIQFNEADGTWDNQIGTTPDNKCGNGGDAGCISQFTMIPIGDYETAVESDSWGAIKTLFQ